VANGAGRQPLNAGAFDFPIDLNTEAEAEAGGCDNLKTIDFCSSPATACRRRLIRPEKKGLPHRHHHHYHHHQQQ